MPPAPARFGAWGTLVREKDKASVMNYANIKYCDIANGVGVRTTLFVSGCRVRCPGCFNEEAWDFDAGRPFDDEVAGRVLKSLEPEWIEGLTVLGGEPFEPENQAGLLPFLQQVRERFPQKSIWCFSGYVYDRDIAPADGARHTDVTNALLDCIDVLVDGPFVAEEHSVTLRFKGSANQRLIDLAAMRSARRELLANGGDPADAPIVPWHDDEVYATHTM